jgi:hypothetical protein
MTPKPMETTVVKKRYSLKSDHIGLKQDILWREKETWIIVKHLLGLYYDKKVTKEKLRNAIRNIQTQLDEISGEMGAVNI